MGCKAKKKERLSDFSDFRDFSDYIFAGKKEIFSREILGIGQRVHADDFGLEKLAISSLVRKLEYVFNLKNDQ